jgi:hypothetical protein
LFIESLIQNNRFGLLFLHKALLSSTVLFFKSTRFPPESVFQNLLFYQEIIDFPSPVVEIVRYTGVVALALPPKAGWWPLAVAPRWPSLSADRPD